MGKKILVADDETEVTGILKHYFGKKGHEVSIADDGRKALELIKGNDFDLIFVDHNMPELTGLELVAYVKQHQLRSKIVLITGYLEIEEFLAKAEGADGYLEKPVRLEVLEKIVNAS
ncbi:MAG: response regulator [Candidatus Omnitrophica bacterium]|nr:response regulator [Candidatus Omnitrophota bacterium]